MVLDCGLIGANHLKSCCYKSMLYIGAFYSAVFYWRSAAYGALFCYYSAGYGAVVFAL